MCCVQAIISDKYGVPDSLGKQTAAMGFCNAHCCSRGVFETRPACAARTVPLFVPALEFRTGLRLGTQPQAFCTFQAQAFSIYAVQVGKGPCTEYLTLEAFGVPTAKQQLMRQA